MSAETLDQPLDNATISPEDQEILKQKCKDLKKKIITVEESNKLAALAILRTKKNINRLRLEYSILLERLESKIVLPNENDHDSSEDEIEFSDKKSSKKKKNINGSTTRDADQPKRPLNAYLIFCEMEKENLKKQAEQEGRTIDLSKTLGETWKNLDDEGKQMYVDLYTKDKERYQREMDIYEKGGKRQKLDVVEPKIEDEKTQSPEP